MGADDDVLPFVTSANIACGMHAGDAGTMRRTVASSLRHGVALGAHPGFADRAGFGRREMELPADEIRELVIDQIGALAAVARTQGARLAHVKPHGALYNMAATRRAVADAIAGAVRSVDASLVLFGLAGSELVSAGRAVGLVVAEEVFADRRYAADATLVPRSEAGSLITDAPGVIEQALRMVREGRVRSLSGPDVRVRADTICLHGDTPGAAALARALRAALERDGVSVAAPGGTRMTRA